MTSRDLSADVAWRAVDPGDLVWAQWGGEYVLYHRPSGKTHFVNAATALLLQSVLLAPKTAVAAAEELAAAQSAAGDETFFAAVANLLERLEHLGLVEPRVD